MLQHLQPPKNRYSDPDRLVVPIEKLAAFDGRGIRYPKLANKAEHIHASTPAFNSPPEPTLSAFTFGSRIRILWSCEQ